MKLIKLTFSILLTVLVFSSVDAQHCSKLPTEFENADDAITQVKAAEFEFSDKVNVYSSSWLEKAEYYSCDGEHGFLIYKTLEDKMGIHANVPKILWTGFKDSDSQSTYYNDYFKGRYSLTDSSK